MGPRPLLQDGDQPTVEVERPHFWFFYISLLSGQYRLLMGQKRHSLTLGAFLAPVLDVTAAEACRYFLEALVWSGGRNGNTGLFSVIHLF